MGFVDAYINPLLGGFGVCELSFAIDKELRRQGVMKNALQTCIDFLMKKEHFYRIEAHVMTNNDASLSLLASLGFQTEGIQRKKWVFNKGRHDAVLLSLIKDDLSQTKADNECRC